MIVGNEPNLNRFWLPQFDEREATPPRRPTSRSSRGPRRRQGGGRGRAIWGGALAPRGIDRPGTGRDTHSPTTFIRDLGAAYRASGRDEPPLDGFAFHPYPASSSIAARRAHEPASKSILMADYEEKLRPLLDEAFGPGCPSSTASSASRRGSAGEGGALRRRGAGAPGRRGDPGRLLPPRDRARLLPGERRRAAALPLARRAGADGLPVGRLLRRRDAEVEPGRSAKRSQRRGAEYDVAVSERAPEGQYVAYTFYKRRPRLAPAAGRGAGGDEGRVRGGDRELERAVRAPARLFDGRRAPRLRLLPLEDHRALRRPGRARRRAERHAAGRWLETPYSYLATTKASPYT